MASQKFEVGFIISASDRMSTVINHAVRNADERFHSLQRGLHNLNSFSTRIWTAGALIAAGIWKTAEAAEGSEISNLRLENVFRQMWGGSGPAMQAAKGAEEYANKLQYSIGVGASEIKLVQAKLATFQHLSNRLGIVSGLYNRATQAAYDLAATGYGDAINNATQLGKALEDPLRMATALKRTGTITPDDLARVQQIAQTKGRFAAQLVVMKAIERQVKGNAEKTATATEIISVGLKSVVKTIGNIYLPYFKSAGKGTLSYVDKVKKAITAHSGLILKLTKYGLILMAITGGLRILSTFLNFAISTYKVFSIIIALNTKYMIFSKIASLAVSGATKIAAAAQWLLNASMYGFPVVWIIAGLAAVTVAVVILWKKFAWFRAGVLTAWTAIKGFAATLGTYIYNRVMGLIKGVKLLTKALIDLRSLKFSSAWNDVKEGTDQLFGFSATNKAIHGVINTYTAIPSNYKSNLEKESRKTVKNNKSVSVTYSPTVTINGNANKDDFKKMLNDHKTDLISIIDKNKYNQKRLSY